MPDLDTVDFGILDLLQEDARNLTPRAMAEQLPVSAQTVRNRLSKLEEAGVVEGYVPVINYAKAGFPLRLQFTCTAPVDDREELARAVLDIPHFVRAAELLSARENLLTEAVTHGAKDIDRLVRQLVGLGLTIEGERLVRAEYSRPVNHAHDRPTDRT